MKITKLFENIPVLQMNIDPETEVFSVSSDSRKIKEKAAFVCLSGLTVDGRKFIPSAFEKGAVVAVCEVAPEGDYPFVLVEDTRAALPRLLSNLYEHPENSFQRIIGITGTNGKTTTSFMLKSIFEEAGHKTGLIGTTKYLVDNEEYKVDKNAAFLTTPDPELLFALFDAMRKKNVDTVIMEASSHALALKKLTGVPFDLGIFTNLTQDHIDFHKTMEEYLQAKKSLFFVAKEGVFNGDDPAFESITSGITAAVTSYGSNTDCDFCVKEIITHDDRGIRYLLEEKGKTFEIALSVSGTFNIYNSLAAIATARKCGIAMESIQKGLISMEGVKGRIERIPTDTPYSVFIDFAHTPDALENILTTLRGFTKGKLVTLFGCGGDRDRTKRPLMGEIACQKSDFVIVTSDNCRSEKKEDIIRDILVGVEGKGTPFVSITDRTEAIHYAIDHAEEGDVILLAGKGHEEYEIDNTGKHDYSEKNIVLEYIGDRK